MSSEFNDEDLEKIDLDYPEPRDERQEEMEKATTDSEDDDPSRLSGILQFVIISIIIVILLASVFILIRWQRGKAPQATDQNDVAAHNVESIDFPVSFDPNKIDDYVDDGVHNIVILGDDTLLPGMGENGISDLVAEATGANVTALALPGGTVALHDLSYSLEHPEDAYSLFYVATDMCVGDTGNYDLQFAALSEIEDNKIYYDYWDVLHTIDFDKVDTLLLCYGYGDYIAGMPLKEGEENEDQLFGHENGTAGALDDSLKLLTERFPYMQIIIVSPSFCFAANEDGDMEGVDVYNTGNGTLGDYVVTMMAVAQENRVAFVDNYFFEGFNYASYENFLEEDGSFPNEAGRRLIVDHLVRFIYTGNRLGE